MCLLSSQETPDVYPSKELTSPFQNLTITSGNVCPASDTPGNTTSGAGGEAAVLRTCPETEVCYSVNVPEKSASSGSGDIYFQLSAPTSYSWVALAQGTAMDNANMFLMHSSADGKNVTLSARSTTGHVMPTHNNATEVSLMDGSGVSNGRMTANVRCGNCNSWSTGTMSLKDSNSDWLYAFRQGSPIGSDDLNAVITEHDKKGAFQWDLSRATGGTAPNPFTAAATTANSSSSGSDWEKLSAQTQNQYSNAHGALAGLAFIAILPLGAILVRLTSLGAWIHGGLQIVGYIIFIAAAGLGIYIAKASDRLNDPHVIIGLLLLAVLFFMPFIGAIHHKVYQKVQKRTLWSYGHIFTGRAAIVLGIVNGGLGLRLADAGNSSKIAYGVLAGLIGAVYIGAIVFGELKRGRNVSQNSTAAPFAELKRRDGGGSGRDTSEEHSLS
jgi:hypothetical protein